MKNFFLANRSKVLLGIALVLAMPLMYSTAALAQPIVAPPAPNSSIDDVGDVFLLINDIFNILFWLLIVLAAVFIIWAAFTYLTAGGDPEKVKKANHRVIYAVVAVVVAVLAKAIPAVVCNFVSDTGCDLSVDGRPVT